MTTDMIIHSICGSRVYIGMYIHEYMTSQCSFTITNKLFLPMHIISFLSYQ